MSVLWVVLALGLMFTGFVVLAAGMERHQQDLGTERLSAARLRGWQVAGGALLVLALWPCFVRWSSVSVSLAAWTGLLTLAGVALGLLFTYSPKGVQYLKALVGGVVALTAGGGAKKVQQAPVQGKKA